MANIHMLSQDTINKIAAGEVIERPMAVVKELIENAIDAKANSIAVEISDGGKGLIRITDNGSGIEQDDIELAFTPHATSKIKEVTDLLMVSSLGFRGEALASIASVSQLEMITKTRDALMGTRYCIDGGQKKAQESVGCPEGTTFLIRNLFYNTPARLKFLKTSQTEAGYISGLMERMALSHPDIAFRFINQKQTKLSTSGNGNLKDVIYHIYGREITANLIETDRNEVFCKMTGFIGKPVISRGNRAMMNYFINGRYIKSPVIQKAIEEAYAPYTMQHRYPFTALHLQIAPEYIDVNVHPQKMEIRFNNEKEIFQSVYHGVSEALKHRKFIPEVTFQTHPAKTKEAKTPHIEPFEKKRMENMKNKPESHINRQIKENGLSPKESMTVLQELSKDVKIQKDIFSNANETKYGNTENAEVQKNSIVSEAEIMSKISAKENIPDNPKICAKESIPDKRKELSEEIAEVTEDGNVKESAPYLSQQPQITDVKQETLFSEGILSSKAEKEVKIIGQVFSTYWILQYEDAMYLVDQHAAHEKVLYERFMQEIKQKQPMTQMLQPPVILSLSMIQQQAVEENMQIFEQLGYQIENFGGREYAVSGVPAHLPEVGSQDLLIEIIDSLTEERNLRKTPELLLDKIASMSCKAAVKGNQSLPFEQMQELLKELMTLENPYHCPHGRPTMIRMTKKELEKKFKRIV